MCIVMFCFIIHSRIELFSVLIHVLVCLFSFVICFWHEKKNKRLICVSIFLIVLSNSIWYIDAAPKRRKFVLEVDFNAKHIPLKYKQFTIDDMLNLKSRHMIENKENMNDDPVFVN